MHMASGWEEPENIIVSIVQGLVLSTLHLQFPFNVPIIPIVGFYTDFIYY